MDQENEKNGQSTLLVSHLNPYAYLCAIRIEKCFSEKY